jgi:hypothetical protein
MNVNEIVSHEVFRWFLTAFTGGLASFWVFYDSFNILRLRNADKRDPLVRDKIFGYVVGIAIGVIGCLGCLFFHDVI